MYGADIGRSDDHGHEPVPDAGGVLGRADGLERAAAGPVQVAVDRPPTGSVVVSRDGLGELGGSGRVPVAEGHRAASLDGIAAAGRTELDGAVGRLLVGQRIGVLEEAAAPLLGRRQVDGEADVGALEVSRHPMVHDGTREVLLRVDHRAAYVGSTQSAVTCTGDCVVSQFGGAAVATPAGPASVRLKVSPTPVASARTRGRVASDECG